MVAVDNPVDAPVDAAVDNPTCSTRWTPRASIPCLSTSLSTASTLSVSGATTVFPLSTGLGDPDKEENLDPDRMVVA